MARYMVHTGIRILRFTNCAGHGWRLATEYAHRKRVTVYVTDAVTKKPVLVAGRRYL